MTNARDHDLVQPQDACPVCSERRVDCLVWIDDEHVECGMCGTTYTPQAAERDSDPST